MGLALGTPTTPGAPARAPEPATVVVVFLQTPPRDADGAARDTETGVHAHLQGGAAELRAPLLPGPAGAGAGEGAGAGAGAGFSQPACGGSVAQPSPGAPGLPPSLSCGTFLDLKER